MATDNVKTKDYMRIFGHKYGCITVLHVADVDFCRGLLAIACLASRSVDMQMWPSLFTHEKSISPLSNNTNCSNCISIVSNRMQSEILKLPLGNSSIQILRDRSWRWAFATSFPGNCACKTSWVPHISGATLFNGRDSVMNLRPLATTCRSLWPRLKKNASPC